MITAIEIIVRNIDTKCVTFPGDMVGYPKTLNNEKYMVFITC